MILRNGAVPTEKLISRDPVLGDLFTHCRDDAFEFRKACFFCLLGECLCLRFKFEISSHILRGNLITMVRLSTQPAIP